MREDLSKPGDAGQLGNQLSNDWKRQFSMDEDGAITVDWLVITALAAIIGAAIVAPLYPILTTKLDSIAAQIIASTSE